MRIETKFNIDQDVIWNTKYDDRTLNFYTGKIVGIDAYIHSENDVSINYVIRENPKKLSNVDEIFLRLSPEQESK